MLFFHVGSNAVVCEIEPLFHLSNTAFDLTGATFNERNKNQNPHSHKKGNFRSFLFLARFFRKRGRILNFGSFKIFG